MGARWTKTRGLPLVTVAICCASASCDGPAEQIPVGARLQEARGRGQVPELRPGAGALTGAEASELGLLALSAAERNLQPAHWTDVLAKLGVPTPLREDAVAFVQQLRKQAVPAENVPIYLADFVLSRHDSSGAAKATDVGALAAVGLAFAFDNSALLHRLLVDDATSRTLHCQHKTKPDVLMTAYATPLVARLHKQGWACRPVRLER